MAKAQTQPKPPQFDVAALRRDFPALAQEINGHPLVYFDNAATTQKPQAVIDTLSHFYSHDNANVHRGLHALSERATQAYENARVTAQHFINAKDWREIVFVRGTTEAINLVANSFLWPRLRPGEEIIITEMEHHSNIVPWQILSKNTGVNIRVVPFNEDGELMLEDFEKLITEDTKFLSVGHISNALGTINPIKKMIEIAHANDMLVMIDGAQAAPHLTVDVQDLDCDFYAFSGHKAYGPTGIGVLYAKAELLDMMAPYQGGGEMIAHVSFDKTEYAPIPHKFEAGTPNIAGAIGLATALDYLNQVGLDAIAQYEHDLLQYLKMRAQDVKGIGYIGSAKEKTSIFSFVMQDVHAHDIGTVLNSLGIAIRSGHHCAMPVMDHFEIPACARASLAFYNTYEEIDKFIEALAQVYEVFT